MTVFIVVNARRKQVIPWRYYEICEANDPARIQGLVIFLRVFARFAVKFQS